MVIRRSTNIARRRDASARGVMLADILVAVVLLGSALAMMVAMTGRAMRAQRAGEELEVAAMLLDEQLQLVLARGPDNYGARFPLEGVCEAPYESFRYRLEITAASGSAYVVVATVTWASGGRVRTESVETRIAPRRGDDPDPDRKPQETVDRLP
ncbi:MAG: hypothetical protein WCK33_11710 [Phycisphaerae bacterium]